MNRITSELIPKQIFSNVCSIPDKSAGSLCAKRIKNLATKYRIGEKNSKYYFILFTNAIAPPHQRYSQVIHFRSYQKNNA